MKIKVNVKANSRQESVSQDGNGIYTVRANAPAVDGKANQRVIYLLSKEFKCSKSSIELIAGQKSKIKCFKVPKSD